jgi:hypothetical protein
MGTMVYGRGPVMSTTTRTTGFGRVANCATRTRDSPPDPTGTALAAVLSTTPRRSITRREGFFSSKCSCASPPSAVSTMVFSLSSPRASTDSRECARAPEGAAPLTTFVPCPDPWEARAVVPLPGFAGAVSGSGFSSDDASLATLPEGGSPVAGRFSIGAPSDDVCGVALSAT